LSLITRQIKKPRGRERHAIGEKGKEGREINNNFF